MWGKSVKLLLVGCSLVMVLSSIRAQSVREYNHILQQGEEAVKEGNIERALTLWESMTEGSPEQLTDPRIGISYIEVVTRERLIEQYSKASELYYWGLSNPIHPNFEEELAREVKRLEPVAKREEYKQWRQLLKEGRLQTLGKSVSGFWKRMDPTLDTPFNERLVEHWKRIAYAREHFKLSSSTVYETDERALIYLKYGEPSRKRNGVINLNVGQVQNWINDSSESGFFPDPSAVTAEDSMQIARDAAQKILEIKKMMNRIKLYHRYPRYEIWVYNQIEDRHRNNLIYIFGNDGDTGEFTMLNSLEEMMPNSAFRSIPFQQNSVPPSFFLQLLYYGEMVNVDSYFAEAFRELESRLYTISGPSRHNSFYQMSQNRSKLAQSRFSAPVEQSSYASSMPHIPIEVQQYRLLDEKNEPFLATFVYSRPHRSFYIDQLKRDLFDGWAYSVNTSVMNTDPDNEVLYREKNSQRMRSDTGRVEQMRPLVDYFEIPQDSITTTQVFSVELRNSRMDSTTMREVLFPENIRALGKLSMPQTDPLLTDESTLEMGDLIIGYKDSLSDTNNPYGFTVGHENTIPNGKNLMVHIEIYHLKVDSTGATPFKIDYSVTTDKNFFQRLFTKKEETRLTLNFETSSTIFRDNLEVETTPFEPGPHTLTLKVTDLGSNQIVEREIDFEIKETDEKGGGS